MDEWHDYVRLLALAINVFTLTTLILRFVPNRNAWNEKTLDLWYTLFMWTVAGITFCIQGIAFDRQFNAAFVAVVAASLVGGKAVHKKGSWGSDHS